VARVKINPAKEISTMLIVFLGRSLDGILADARDVFSDKEVLVVARNGDQLQPPVGLTTIEVSQFQPQFGVEYTVVSNGGTSAQLVPVLRELVRVGAPMKVFDLQRDGVVQLW